MKDKRVLFVSSEVIPYLPETNISSMSYLAAKMVNEREGQIRIFMPRFGNINERRHQLHEVIRLSGINLVVNDLDMPLIIKVASIPRERMQVYFIDNEDYFKRKATLTDEEGNLFKDNDERMIFFAKGVVETVKKLNWAPDIIHVHGWLASLLPLYLKNYFGKEPLFVDSKIVTSIYNDSFAGTLDEQLIEKLRFDVIDEEKVSVLKKPSYENLVKVAVDNSDAIIQGDENIEDSILKILESSKKPLLGYYDRTSFSDAYENFYLTEVLEKSNDA
ncbi:MAG: glycogen/starch synthase [Flavobacteriaceae bacterium]|nr:glycogen/starch synthase [Flavobacteriaceae bacterium]